MEDWIISFTPEEAAGILNRYYGTEDTIEEIEVNCSEKDLKEALLNMI